MQRWACSVIHLWQINIGKTITITITCQLSNDYSQWWNNEAITPYKWKYFYYHIIIIIIKRIDICSPSETIDTSNSGMVFPAPVGRAASTWFSQSSAVIAVKMSTLIFVGLKLHIYNFKKSWNEVLLHLFVYSCGH